MAFLIDQLNNSGLFAQSAYSACIATKDSDGNIITATYLSSHQPISANEWNSSYETVKSNSGTWNTKQDLLEFKYDSINNNISSINDSAFNASTFSYGAIGRDPRNAYSAVNYIQLGSGNDGGIFMGHSTFGTAYYKTNEFVLNRGTTGQIKFNVGGGGPVINVSGKNKSDIVLAAINAGVSSIYGSSSINISANGNLYEINPSSINGWNSNYNTVFNNSAYWSDSNITVQNNSASWNNVTNKLDTTAFSDVSGTFLTAHQSLDGYATTAWVDSQGYLTAHQPISADEWNDVYDTVNVYSGSWTGSESSPTASVDSNGSIDIVSSNNTVYFDVNGTWFNDAVNSALPTSATQWNSNYDTVNTNSGVWGGSALNISAGEGVKVTLVNNNLVFSTDETVLWSDTTNGLTSGSLVLNEPWSGFERIRLHVIDKFGWGGSCIEYDTTNLAGARTKHFACTYSFIVTGSPNKTFNRGIILDFANGQYISGSSVGIETLFTPTSTIESKIVLNGPSLIKVIGINRINNA